MIYFLLSTLACLAGLLIIYWLHNQYHLDLHVSPQARSASQAPAVSICIPARNEERNIRACVEAALDQTYPNFEVLVVDDQSTDSTLKILEELKTRHPSLGVVRGKALPPGWAGKPHALHQAATLARGEWLCFIDADTWLAPEALQACVSCAQETGADLFTIMTRQVMGTFWEKVVLPIVMTALSVGFSPRKVNDPKRRDAIANGQFILIQRSVYRAIGGHARIKDQIVEDKALSEQVKRNGYRLVVADGMQVARTRMYTSLAEMWEGWTKNIYLGLHDRLDLLWLGVCGAVLSLIATLFLPLWPLLGLYWFSRHGGWMALSIALESLAVWGAVLYMRARVAQRSGISRWYALSTPLGTGTFAAMMIASAWLVLSGQGVTWRGRKYRPLKHR